MIKYRVPDRLSTCIIGRYATDRWKYNYKYRVPDMYPIASILTSVGYHRPNIHSCKMAICFDCWKLVEITDIKPKDIFQ